MSIYDAGTLFQQTLLAPIGRNAQQRVPFSFTSTQRLLKAGVVNINNRDQSKAQAQATLTQELLAIEANNLTTAVQPPGVNLYANQLQVPSALPIVSMMVNPHTVQWSQPKRFTKRDTMNGSTYFHFSDVNGQNNDILTLKFSGNTGNINTKDISSSQAVGGDAKLKIWHELYALTREPMLLDGGVKNEFFISYRTPLMPIQITFIGFFTSVLEFTESAATPFSREYSFSFIVTNTSPSLDKLVDKISSAVAFSGVVSTGNILP